VITNVSIRRWLAWHLASRKKPAIDVNFDSFENGAMAAARVGASLETSVAVI
jgi:hypothetical protein